MNKSLLTSLHVAESMAHVAKIAEQNSFARWNTLQADEQIAALAHFFTLSPGASILLSGICEHYLTEADTRLVSGWTETYKVTLADMPKFYQLVEELLRHFHVQGSRSYFSNDQWFKMDITPNDHVVRALLNDDARELDIFKAASIGELAQKASTLPTALGLQPGTDAGLSRLRMELTRRNPHLPLMDFLTQLGLPHFFSFLYLVDRYLQRRGAMEWADVGNHFELESLCVESWTQSFHHSPNVLLDDEWVRWTEENKPGCLSLNDAGYVLTEKTVTLLFKGLKVPLK